MSSAPQQKQCSNAGGGGWGRRGRGITYFTIFLLFGPLWTSNTVLQGNILDESIVLRYWKIWLFLLTKIELHGAVVAENMWEERPSSKNFLTDFEGNTKLLSILCIGEFHFITFKVLLIGGGGVTVLRLIKTLKIQTRYEAYPVENTFRLNIKKFRMVKNSETPVSRSKNNMALESKTRFPGQLDVKYRF